MYAIYSRDVPYEVPAKYHFVEITFIMSTAHRLHVFAEAPVEPLRNSFTIQLLTSVSSTAPPNSLELIYSTVDLAHFASTVQLHLSGLNGTVIHPDMQKIRIIGLFFESGLHWHFEVGKKILQTAVLIYIFTYVQIKHYSGDDRQLSPLTRTLGIPYIIWEPLRSLLFTVSTCV